MEVVLIAALLAFFALTAGYVVFCDRLIDREPAANEWSERASG